MQCINKQQRHDMGEYKSYYHKKYCIVPKCESTSYRTPEKLFFCVPKNPKLREKWCRVMKRDGLSDTSKQKELSVKTTHYCCEDHFYLEEDMQNYMQYKLMKNVRRIFLKPGVLPHRFDCQKEPLTISQAAAKKKRLQLMEEAISQAKLISLSLTLEANSRASAEANEETHSNIGVNSIEETHSNKGVDSYEETDSNSRVNSNQGTDSCVEECKPNANETSTTSQENNSLEEEHCKPSKVGTNLIDKSTATLSIKLPVKEEVSSDNSIYSIPDSPKYISNDETSVSSWDESSDSLKEDELLMRDQMCKYTMFYIEKNPLLFLGVSANSYFIIEVIQERTKLPLKNIYIALKKIRMNPPFEALAIDFGLSESQIKEIFKTSIPQISAVLKAFVFWPSPEVVFEQLPIPFQQHYNKVYCLLYCLEIQIERPSNRVHPSLAWSNYYNCHTLKFLISYTPDGLINFFSGGFGGNITDALIVEESNFLEKLSPGSQVMVDRGFEGVDHLLLRKNCTLVRLPSVSAGDYSSNAGVQHAERTAAVRIYAEQVIERTRGYQLLLPRSCLEKSLMIYIDDIVGAVCGLLNMQDDYYLRNLLNIC